MYIGRVVIKYDIAKQHFLANINDSVVYNIFFSSVNVSRFSMSLRHQDANTFSACENLRSSSAIITPAEVSSYGCNMTI